MINPVFKTILHDLIVKKSNDAEFWETRAWPERRHQPRLRNVLMDGRTENLSNDSRGRRGSSYDGHVDKRMASCLHQTYTSGMQSSTYNPLLCYWNSDNWYSGKKFNCFCQTVMQKDAMFQMWNVGLHHCRCRRGLWCGVNDALL